MTRRIEHWKKDNGSLNTTVTITPERVTIKVGTRDEARYDDVVDEVLAIAQDIPQDSKSLRGAYRIEDGLMVLRSCHGSQALGFWDGVLTFVQVDNKVIYQARM